MKTCPVCKAQLFDDMTVCYGCMYHFETLPSHSPVSLGNDSGGVLDSTFFEEEPGQPDESTVSRFSAHNRRGDGEPAFHNQAESIQRKTGFNSLTGPVDGAESNPWIGRIELADRSHPELCWTIELNEKSLRQALPKAYS